jgi:transcriptional regulator with XRE-family HTH domain
MSDNRSFSFQVRAAIEASGMTRRDISARLGVGESLLSHFMKGRKGLSVPVIDRLIELLGLELVARRKGSRG